ncbi:MAG: ABC transporter ATP-binding protein [candidate division Zixibacteria bacterium]|nr:ABC transporter ATP-binding protein [candidate division Zixibacteria bacterium]
MIKNDRPVPIEVHDLTVAYRKKPVLWNIDFSLPEGHLIGLVGPNGAGKSTLIQAIMGLLPVLSGYVKVYGHPLEKNRQLIGYVPQRESVDWDFPVDALDVVTMGRYGHMNAFGKLSKQDREIALSALDKVGMADFAKRQISQLSGGQQQRVFIARALAQEASVYLMDEPFAGVDANTEKAIVALLKELKDRGKTCLVVHHDLHTVREYFDWVMLLNMRLVKFGPTAEIYNEENLRATYGGKLVLLAEAAEKLITKS